MPSKNYRNPEVARIIAHLDDTDRVRDTVSRAIKLQLNGHMSPDSVQSMFVAGATTRCSNCGNMYLERRGPERPGVGTCLKCCQP